MIYIFKKENGEQLKVNSIDSVKLLIEDGIIKESTQVKKGLRGKWQQVSEISELNELFTVPSIEEADEIIEETHEEDVLEEESKNTKETVADEKDNEIYSRPKEKIKLKKEKENIAKEENIITEKKVEEIPAAAFTKNDETKTSTAKNYSDDNQKLLDKIFDDQNILGLSIGQCILAAFKNTFKIAPRASRGEYWWVLLLYIILYVFMLLEKQAPILSGISTIGIIILFIPSITLGIRRLHDTNRSGWWLLISIIPFGGFVLLFMVAQKGTAGSNHYGKYPLSVKTENLTAEELDIYNNLPDHIEKSNEETHERYEDIEKENKKEEKIEENNFEESPSPELITEAKKKNNFKIIASLGVAVFCILAVGIYLSNDQNKTNVKKIETKEKIPLNKKKPSFSLFDNYQKGYDLAKEGKYLEAQNVWLKCANKGNKDCMYGMGTLYLKDERLGKDPQKASFWFIKAADKGHAKGAYNAGFAYYKGDGVMRDFTSAKKYFLISHKNDFVTGTYALGTLLMNDQYEGKDLEKSFYYTKLAADKGHLKGQFFTGIRYLSNDQGAKKDYQQAAKYLKLAADNGNLEALYWLGRTYSYDDNTTKNLPKAFQFLEKAKSYKVQDSYLALSLLYEKNMQYRKAFDVCSEGANLGDDKCHSALGYYYFSGQSVPKNLIQSTKHYVIANKIKYSSKRADYVLENMNLMSSYQQELARNYANTWLEENKNILNGEKFYKEKKDNNSIANQSNSKNSISSNLKEKVFFNGEYYKKRNSSDYKSKTGGKRDCTEFYSKKYYYYLCESSTRFSYSKEFLENDFPYNTNDILRYTSFKNGKQDIAYKSLREGQDNKIILRGGWIDEKGVFYGVRNENTKTWIAYHEEGKSYRSDTGLSETEVKKLIDKSKKYFNDAIQVKKDVEKLLGKQIVKGKFEAFINNR